MASDDAMLGKVDQALNYNVELGDTTPEGAWVTREIAGSVSEKIDRAPVGALYELVYAVLASRLREVLSPDNNLSGLMIDQLVHTAVNFRSLNPNFFAGGGRVPTTPPNSGAGSGAYHSALWGPAHDERLPNAAPLPTTDHTLAAGQDATPMQNRGLLIAKLFTDLQQHLPVVLFNITSKTYQPIGIGGSSASRRFYKDGQVITELAYRAIISVEATAVAEDDEAASNLQAIVEMAFGTLRDHVGSGSSVSGKSWQIMMPMQVSPSPITETEAPWAQGDDKGGKLYIGTVGLDNMSFESVSYIGKPVTLHLTTPPDLSFNGQAHLALASGDPDPDGPIHMKLGKKERLVLTNAPLTSDLVVSQSKRVVELRKPYHGSGVYEIIPRRTGEATLVLYDTGMTLSAMSNEPPTARVGEPLVQRKVVVTAV